VGSIKKRDISGKETGTVSVDDSKLDCKANSQMIKDYIIAIRRNARQWSANTKDRSEVSKTGKKPHAQKGLGRARQGSFAAPQYKGGGVVFGPKPKFDQHIRINRKERKRAIGYLIANLIKEDKVTILEGYKEDKPKTKAVASFFDAIDMKSGRTLVIGSCPEISKNAEDQSSIAFSLSMRNIPKKHFLYANQLNGYELMLAQNIVILENAADDVLKLIEQGA